MYGNKYILHISSIIKVACSNLLHVTAGKYLWSPLSVRLWKIYFLMYVWSHQESWFIVWRQIWLSIRRLSCYTMGGNIYDNIMSNLEKCRYMLLIWCDISKAFDKVWHKGLIFKFKNLRLSSYILLGLMNILAIDNATVISNTAFWWYLCLRLLKILSHHLCTLMKISKK